MFWFMFFLCVCFDFVYSFVFANSGNLKEVKDVCESLVFTEYKPLHREAVWGEGRVQPLWNRKVVSLRNQLEIGFGLAGQ